MTSQTDLDTALPLRPGTSTTWNERADLAQADLDRFFGAPGPQLLHNRHPSDDRDDELFNYWWIAHAIDARLDAYERTGDTRWLQSARDYAANIFSGDLIMLSHSSPSNAT